MHHHHNGGLRYLVIMLFFLLPAEAFSQEAVPRPLKGPAPSWVQPFDYKRDFSPQKKDIEGGEYLDLYEEQQNLEKEAVYHKIVRKITSDAGVQNGSEISISYDPSYQHLTFSSLRIVRGDKTIDILQSASIKLVRNETDLESFIYSGMYTALVVVNDVRSGDKIEYSYTLSGRNPVFAHHYGQLFYFYSGNPIGTLFIRLITPRERPLHFRYFNGAPKPKRTKWDGKIVYQWNLSARPGYTSDDNEPSWYYGGPYIQATTDSSWKEITDWALQNMKDASRGASPLIEKKISEWDKESKDNDLDYVRLATRFVQDQIRYMGIEMGPYSERPHTPAQVMKQRYGDCKDKSLLLCTLLKRRNIDAHVAYVSTVDGARLQNYLPSIGLFDHAIVTFSLDSVSYWIDPTISYERGEIWDQATPDYGYALVIRKGEDSLERMKVVRDMGTSVTETFTLPKDNSGSCILDVTTTYLGSSADDIRVRLKESGVKDIQKSYRDYYNQLYGRVSVADSLRFTDDIEENKITVYERYRIKEPYTVTDSLRQQNEFVAYAKPIQNRLPESVTDDRKSPLSLGPLTNFHYRLQLVLPTDPSVKQKLKTINRESYEYGFYKFKKGDTAELNYAYETNKGYISPASFDTLNNDLSEINEELSYSVLLNEAVIRSGGKVNVLSILLAVIVAGIFSFLALKFYRFSLPARQGWMPPQARRIGGWLILIAIGLCATPLAFIREFILGGLFKQSTWIGAGMNTGLELFLSAQLIASIFLLVYAILLLFLFFKRRDTFPKAIIFNFIIATCILTVNYYLAGNYTQYNTNTTSIEVLRSMVLAAIWIPYFLHSTRVKETFVYPYRKQMISAEEVTDSSEISKTIGSMEES